jgi:hypothetical protein
VRRWEVDIAKILTVPEEEIGRQRRELGNDGGHRKESGASRMQGITQVADVGIRGREKSGNMIV